MFKVKIANVIFGVHPKYAVIKTFFKDFIYDGESAPEFIIKTTDNDIEKERRAVLKEEYSSSYLESLFLERIISEKLLKSYNAMLFHASAVKYKGKAYLFTAPSGTGKSTHASFWKQLLGESAVIINDDKPIIRRIEDEFYVFGTPWNGKHSIGENTFAELKAVCCLTRGENNVIEKISPEKAIPIILEQTIRPNEQEDVIKLLDLVDGIVKSSGLYLLKCNLSPSSAKVSFKGMTGEDYET